jgi:Leucine-rich repeat (LRR) protein
VFDNRLTGTIPTTLGNLNQLTYLGLFANQLTGSIPASLGNLSLLQRLYLANNQLTGDVPSSFTGLTGLLELDVQNNQLVNLPNLASLSGSLFIANNLFQFDDLEPNVSRLSGSRVQKRFGSDAVATPITLDFAAGVPIDLSLPIGGTNNLYQWRKNGTNISGATAATYTIPAAAASDAGLYTLNVTNTVVTATTLTSVDVYVNVRNQTRFSWEDGGPLTADGVKPTAAQTQTYGGVWSDYNGDGFEDVFTLGFSTVNRSAFLYRNNGAGSFIREPSGKIEFSTGRSGAWGDYNNDGRPDLFVPEFVSSDSTDGVSSIYKNIGGGNFQRIVLPGDFLRTGAWIDFDKDGLLDLAVTRSGGVGVYLNRRNDTFQFVSLASSDTQWNPVWADIDNDGDLDVHIPSTSTSAETQTELLRNNGDGTLTKITTGPVATDLFGGTAGLPRGSSWADIDNDGDVDLFVHVSTTTGDGVFYINDGRGEFVRQTATALAGEPIRNGRGSTFADLNNDGYVDLIAIQGAANAISPAVYINNGNGTFTRDITQTFRLSDGFSGVNLTDYNNDGRLDLFVTNFSNTQPFGLYKNVDLANNWLQVSLRGVVSNRDAIGARVSVKANGRWQTFQKLSVNGASNQDLRVLQFGLGSATQADSIKISWPSGYNSVVTNVAGNQRTQITEPNLLADDSTALVAIYNAMGGANWLNKTNWLTGNIRTWYGVKVKNGRLNSLRLNDNGLAGTIPAAVGNLVGLDSLYLNGNQITGAVPAVIGNLNELQIIDLGGNQLTGALPSQLFGLRELRTLGLARNRISGGIPAAIGDLINLRILWLDNNQFSGPFPAQLNLLTQLTEFYIQNNQFTSLPNFSSITTISQANVSTNKLDFVSLEPNVSISGLIYAPQDSVDQRQNVLRELNETQTFSAAIGGTANAYQWKKNNSNLAGATNPTLNIPNLTLADDGTTYSYEATNNLVPGLTLISRPKLLKVSSLRRDSIALRALYSAAGGPNWTNRGNWTTTSLRTGNWFGVTITNNRVTAVNLPNNNLVGAVPSDFGDLRSATTINLSGNRLTRLGTLTNLTSVTTLNLSNNRLGFGSLLPNVGITGISYAGQANIDADLQARPEVGTNFKVKAITDGTGNQYVWRRNGAVVANATDSTYTITAINRSNMGAYVAEITNPGVPNLTLRTGTKNVLAVANITGTVQSTPTAPMNTGVMRLFKVTTVGAYDTVRVQNTIAPDGRYAFNSVVLDDYTVLAAPNTTAFPNDLPTYYTNKLFWEEADKIALSASRNDINITMAKKPTAAPVGQGVIGGFFEEPIGSGREDEVQRNRRVANASVSVRRRVGTGRTTNERLELVAQLTTNQNGEFEFTSLPEGEYLLNLQYPGYPMDERSFINIQIGKGLNRRVSVEALVQADKIVVNKRVVTGWEEDAENLFTVYPNPTRAEINVDINNPNTVASGSLQFVILNAAGQRIRAGVLPGDGLRSYDLNDLSTGVYLLQISQEGRLLSTQRLMVME